MFRISQSLFSVLLLLLPLLQLIVLPGDASATGAVPAKTMGIDPPFTSKPNRGSISQVPDRSPGRFPLGCASAAIGNGAFCVKSAAEEAILTKPSLVKARDGGEAGVIGPWMLWTYGDTLGAPSADGRPISFSAALSPITVPAYASQSEQLAASFPIQFAPHSSFENQYNDCAFKQLTNPTRPSNCDSLTPRPPAPRCVKPAGAQPTTPGVCEADSNVTCTNNNECLARYALWPTRPIEISSSNCSNRQSPSCTGNGIVLFNRYLITCAWCYYWKGTGIARISEKASVVDTTATRDTALLFDPDKGEYGITPHMVKDGYVYVSVFGNNSTTGLGRVPLASFTDKTKYTYWNNNSRQWLSGQSNITFGSSQIGRISWNPYLKRYISIYGKFYCDPNVAAPCDFDPATSPEPNLLTDVMVQSAEAITGPWSAAVSVRTTRKKANQGRLNFNYYVVEQPDLMSNNGKETRVSYHQWANPSDTVVDKLEFGILPGTALCEQMTAPTNVARGQRFAVTVKFKNNGVYPWTSADHKLVNSAGRTDVWSVGKVNLPVSTVSPQQSVTITFYATAPSSSSGYFALIPKLRGTKYPVNGTCSKNIYVQP